MIEEGRSAAAREAAAREQKINEQITEEMRRLGLDTLSFSDESLRADWGKLLDYYGDETLPHALSIYSVEETLAEYAPHRSAKNVSSREIQEEWPSKLRVSSADGGGYAVPFGIPGPEWSNGNTNFRALFGDDYAAKYRNGKLCGGFQSSSEPRFMWGDEFDQLKRELRERVLNNVTAEEYKRWGALLGRAFIEDIRKRIKSRIENEIEYGPEAVNAHGEKLQKLRREYHDSLRQIFNR